MGDFFLLQMDDSFTEDLCFDYRTEGEGGALGWRSPIVRRAKRRPREKGWERARQGALQRQGSSRVPVPLGVLEELQYEQHHHDYHHDDYHCADQISPPPPNARELAFPVGPVGPVGPGAPRERAG